MKLPAVNWPTAVSLLGLIGLVGWLLWLGRGNASVQQAIVAAGVAVLGAVGHYLPALLSRASDAEGR